MKVYRPFLFTFSFRGGSLLPIPSQTSSFARNQHPVTVWLWLYEDVEDVFRRAFSARWDFIAGTFLARSWPCELILRSAAEILPHCHGSWSGVHICAAVPAVILFLGSIFLPETPNSLIERGHFEEGRKVLERIRGVQVPLIVLSPHHTKWKLVNVFVHPFSSAKFYVLWGGGIACKYR